MAKRLVYLTPEQKRLPVHKADRSHAARVAWLLRRLGLALEAGVDHRIARAAYDADFARSTETWRAERSAL